MIAVLQRVKKGSVCVEGEEVGSCGQGLCVLLGVGRDDTEQDAVALAEKIVNLRIFTDENDKMNLSLKDVNGELLLISQFTLYADCRKGNRPSFINAGAPALATELYEYIIESCKKEGYPVQTGEFGADMKVELLNDGPFTIVLDNL